MPRFAQQHHGKGHGDLPARHHQHAVRIDGETEEAVVVGRDPCPEFCGSGRGGVPVLAVTKGLYCSLNNIRRSFREIWLTNAEIDDGMPCSRPFLRPGSSRTSPKALIFCFNFEDGNFVALDANIFIFAYLPPAQPWRHIDVGAKFICFQSIFRLNPVVSGARFSRIYFYFYFFAQRLRRWRQGRQAVRRLSVPAPLPFLYCQPVHHPATAGIRQKRSSTTYSASMPSFGR